MDLATVALCIGIFVLLGTILFVIAKHGTKSQSYEEAMAENRRFAAQQGLFTESSKQKKHQQQQQKKNKKVGKKVKEKPVKEPVFVSEVDSEVPAEEEYEYHHTKGHVEFIEPAIPAEVPKPVKTKAKKVKEPKVKPILINKDDPSCISDVSAPPSPTLKEPQNHFEQIHPKDEFELHCGEKEKKDHSSNESKPAKQDKSGKSHKKHRDNQEPNEYEALKVKHQSSIDKPDTPDLLEQNMAASSSALANMTTEKLLKEAYPLENAPLSASVNGHAPTSGKNKKKKVDNAIQQLSMGSGVNVNLLVQLLSEASMSRSEIQILTDCLLNKQNGPIPEISEWSEGPKDPMQKIKKQLLEKEKALTEKEEAYQAVNARMKELRASLNNEIIRNSQLSQLAQDAATSQRNEMNILQMRAQRSMEEAAALRDQLQHAKSNEANLESQKSQMEMHIKALSDSKASLNSAIGSLQAEIAELKNSNTNLNSDLHAVHNELLTSQHSMTELTRQLDEANRFRGQLEVKIHNSEKYAKVLSEAQAEIQRLSSANTLSQKQAHVYENKQEELNRHNQELLGELNKLSSEKNELNQTVTQLKEQLQTQPTPNGTSTPTDNIVNEKAILAARQEVEDKYTQQLDLLQRQLDQHKDKNNDAMLKVCQEEQNNTKDILQRLFPQISVQGTSHRDWLDKFVASANQELSKPATVVVQPAQAEPTANKEEDDVRLQEMEKQNTHLQALVDKYKQVIDDTEGVLSRLQNNVTAEEERWEKQLLEKQQELDYVRQHTISQLQNKIDTLQKTLDEHNNELSLTDKSVHLTKTNNPSDVMAEVEKLKEENSRLHAKLQSAQSPNGPSQDGSAEK